MSKEKHTPTEQFKSIQMDLTNIRVQVRSNASTVDIDKSLYNLDLNIANKLDKFQNNHDKLVEALQKIVNSEDGHELFLLIEEAEELLTELKL